MSPLPSFTQYRHRKLRLAFIWVALLAIVLPALSALAAPGNVDSAFTSSVTGGVVRATAVQPNGQIVLGGTFLAVNGAERNFLARLNADGTLDQAFTPAVNGNINAVAVLGDGSMIIAGEFTMVGGVSHSRIAKLFANGGLASQFTAALDGAANALAIQADGRILVAGSFSLVSSVARPRIARLDATGQLDQTFGADLDGAVFTLALQAEDRIIIGGDFTTADSYPRAYLARLLPDGEADTSFDASIDGRVTCLAIETDGSVLAGGDFTMADGVAHNRLARFSAFGSADPTFDPSASGSVNSLALQIDGKILAGGQFSQIANANRPFFARLLTDGSADPNFVTSVSSAVNSVALQADGKVLLGGTFDTVGGASHVGLARVENGAATQTLTLSSAGRAQWLRGGTAPETNQVTLELSTDGGAHFTLVGSGTRMVGGWEFTGLALPASGQLRARARTTGGYDTGSNGLVEQVIMYSGLAQPEISVEAPVNTVLQDGISTVTFPSGEVGILGQPIRFTVRNAGPGNLDLHSFTFDGAAASEFEIGGSSAATAIPSGGSTTFDVFFRPGQVGKRDAVLHIGNSDFDASSFDVNLTGMGLASSNADLFDLALSDGTLNPAFASNTLVYTASVAFSVGSVTVRPYADEQHATVRVNNQVVAQGGESDPIPLVVGANVINTVVTAQNGTAMKTYKVTVNRGAAGPGDIEPEFAPVFPDEVITAAVQPDGRILVASRLTPGSNELDRYLVRLNPDGTIDNGFRVRLNGVVQSLAVLGDGRILISGGFLTVNGVARSFLARLNTDGTFDSTFTVTANGTVAAFAVQPDGKVLLGGTFTTVGGQPRNHLARLNANGTLDTVFNPDADGEVATLVRQADGKILIGGNFLNIGGQPAAYFARLNANATLDSNFQAVPDAPVSSIAVDKDGSILIGGFFSHLGIIDRAGFARLGANGFVDDTFSPTGSGSVSSLALQADGKILVAQAYTLVRVNPDGTTDNGFIPNPDGYVNSVALQPDGKVILGGSFTTVGGQRQSNLARLTNNPATQSLSVTSASRVEWLRGGSAPEAVDVTFERSTNGGSTYSLLGLGTRIAGGWELTGLTLTGSGHIRARARISEGLADGSNTVVQSFTAFGAPANPEIVVERPLGTSLNDGISSVVFPANDVGQAGAPVTFTVRNSGAANLTLGAITVTGGAAADFRLSPAVGPVEPGNSTTFSVTFTAGAAGARSAILHILSNDADESPFDINLTGQGILSNNANLTGLTTDLGPIGFDPARTSFAASVPFFATEITLSVTRERPSSSVTFNGVAAVNDQSQPISLNVGSNVIAIVVTAQDGVTKKTYTLTITRLTANPGSTDLGFLPRLDSDVYTAIAQPDGSVLLGGFFTTVGTDSHPYLARVTADGDLDPSFFQSPDGPVYCLVVQPDGKILVGGDFTMIGNVTRNHLARLNANGSLDTGFNPNVDGIVYSLILQPDGRIVLGGAFTSVGGQTRQSIARVDAGGTVLAGFNVTASTVRSMAAQADGKIIVSSATLSSNGVTRNFLARFGPTGILDAPFAPAVNQNVASIAVQADGRILIGGDFTKIGAVDRPFLARIGADGALDATFKPDIDNFTLSIAVQTDGRILIGGGFTVVNGVARSRIARLNANGTLDTTFDALPNNLVNSVALQEDGQVLIGGGFNLIGEQSVGFAARLENVPATVALGPLSAHRVQWLRGGTSPETQQVTFELSTDNGATYTPLDPVLRIAGGWEVSNLNLPNSGLVRFRAATTGGNFNGSSGLVESIYPISLPRIRIQHPAGQDLASGDSVDFGSVLTGQSATQTFTITNVGAAPLNLGAVTRDGAQKADFVVSGLETDTLAAGDSTMLDVTFTPAAAGARAAALHIASNGVDLPIFNITLTGTGILRLPPAVVTTAATAISFTGATVNGTVDAQGASRAITFEFGVTTAYGAIVNASPATLSTDTATPVSAILTGLAPHTVYHYRLHAAGARGEAFGADKTFTTDNHAPVANNDSFVIVPPAGPLIVQGNDTDADGDLLTVATKSAVRPANAGTLAIVNGQLVFSASSTFAASGASFDYTVKDGFGGVSNLATVTLTAGALTVAPTTKEVSATAQPYVIMVSSTGQFTATSTVPWLGVSPAGGAGGPNTTANLLVTVQPNATATTRTGTIKIGDKTHTVTQTAAAGKPIISGLAASYTSNVGRNFTAVITLQNGPATFTATGLPAGITVDSNGTISGRPMASGVFQVSVTARNVFGVSNVLKFQLTVSPLPVGAIGTFEGLLSRSANINANLGARFQLTTMATGAATGKIIVGTKATSFKGQVIIPEATGSSPTLVVELLTGGGSLFLTFDEANDRLSGEMTKGGDSVSVSAWRNAWAGVVGKAADVQGYYSFFLSQNNADPAPPQGYGYGSFTVSPTTGTLKLAGKLPDGSLLSGTAFVGQDGQIAVYVPLYVNRGSFAGQLVINIGAQPPVGNTIGGIPDWFKPAPAPTSKDTVYRAGFGPTPFSADGSRYLAPGKGQRVLGLPAATSNAKLRFTLGGLEVSMKQFDQLLTISNPSATGLTNKVTIPANANKVTLPTLTASTGLFSGTFTIPGSSAALNRPAPFNGQIVTNAAGTRGYGFFLLPKLPASNQTVATSPKLSGRVLLYAAP